MLLLGRTPLKCLISTHGAFAISNHLGTHAAKRASKVCYGPDRCSVSARCFCSLSQRTDRQIDSAMCYKDAPPTPHLHPLPDTFVVSAGWRSELVGARVQGRKEGRKTLTVCMRETESLPWILGKCHCWVAASLFIPISLDLPLLLSVQCARCRRCSSSSTPSPRRGEHGPRRALADAAGGAAAAAAASIAAGAQLAFRRGLSEELQLLPGQWGPLHLSLPARGASRLACAHAPHQLGVMEGDAWRRNLEIDLSVLFI